MAQTSLTWAELRLPREITAIDFISDLHLTVGDGLALEAFAAYLAGTPAHALFILGDFFEVWVGDDSAVPGSLGAHCAQLLRSAIDQDLAVFFMHGNRDFLLGGAFMAQCQAQLLPDPCVLVLGKYRYLLSHGDALCVADTAYQGFRSLVRSPAWQAEFLAKPLALRQAIAAELRAQSEARKITQIKQQQPFMDVDDVAARSWLTAVKANTLIHGHTHLPARHFLGTGANKSLERIVLSDWDAHAKPPRREVLRLQRGRREPLRISLV